MEFYPHCNQCAGLIVAAALPPTSYCARNLAGRSPIAPSIARNWRIFAQTPQIRKIFATAPIPLPAGQYRNSRGRVMRVGVSRLFFVGGDASDWVTVLSQGCCQHA